MQKNIDFDFFRRQQEAAKKDDEDQKSLEIKVNRFNFFICTEIEKLISQLFLFRKFFCLTNLFFGSFLTKNQTKSIVSI